MSKKLFTEILFSMIFAFLVNIFIYFSFSNVYSAPLLNYEAFVNQYSNGVYQYRFLSTWILLQLYDFFSAHPVGFGVKYYFWNKSAEPAMFLSYFTLNTLFLVGCAALLIPILHHKRFATTKQERLMAIAIIVFTIAISQYVLVPYDTSGYFFMLLFMLIYLYFPPVKSIKNALLLGVVLLFSALNRETAALSISFAAVMLFTEVGIKKRSLFPILFLVTIYAIVYLGMRAYYGSYTTHDGSLLKDNFTSSRGYLGMLYWVVFFFFSWLIAKEQNRKLILLFHFFALPYIIMCFYTGALYETRLYVPLFINSMAFAFYNSEMTNKS